MLGPPFPHSMHTHLLRLCERTNVLLLLFGTLSVYVPTSYPVVDKVSFASSRKSQKRHREEVYTYAHVSRRSKPHGFLASEFGVPVDQSEVVAVAVQYSSLWILCCFTTYSSARRGLCQEQNSLVSIYHVGREYRASLRLERS